VWLRAVMDYNMNRPHSALGNVTPEEYALQKQLLALVSEKGIPYEMVDTNRLSEEEIQTAYIDACMPSVYKKFKLRQVFGSRRRHTRSCLVSWARRCV